MRPVIHRSLSITASKEPKLYEHERLYQAKRDAADDLYAALTLWLAYDDQDEADFAQAGPMLLYARAIDATRKALAKVRGEQSL